MLCLPFAQKNPEGVEIGDERLYRELSPQGYMVRLYWIYPVGPTRTIYRTKRYGLLT